MKKEIRELFPNWINETDKKYDLILGDDVDSVVSSSLLETITNSNWKVNYFYDFKNFYRHEKTENKTIGVDMAFLKSRCFDNHISKRTKNDIHNELCANLNIVHNISCENYTSKYSMSTLMLIMSLYDIPFLVVYVFFVSFPLNLLFILSYLSTYFFPNPGEANIIGLYSL